MSRTHSNGRGKILMFFAQPVPEDLALILPGLTWKIFLLPSLCQFSHKAIDKALKSDFLLASCNRSIFLSLEDESGASIHWSVLEWPKTSQPFGLFKRWQMATSWNKSVPDSFSLKQGCQYKWELSHYLSGFTRDHLIHFSYLKAGCPVSIALQGASIMEALCI